jgi:hypothetical protein
MHYIHCDKSLHHTPNLTPDQTYTSQAGYRYRGL